MLPSKTRTDFTPHVQYTSTIYLSVSTCVPSSWFLTLTACRLIVKLSCQKIDDWVVSKSRKSIFLIFCIQEFPHQNVYLVKTGKRKYCHYVNDNCSSDLCFYSFVKTRLFENIMKIFCTIFKLMFCTSCCQKH